VTVSQIRASEYARFYSPITGRMVGPLLDAAGVRAGTRVLDVAAGPGCMTARAARRGAAVVGVDLDGSMVALARRRHPTLDFRQAAAEELPFEDASFDAVVANFLVHHLRSPSDAMSELVRVLAPGGVIALSAWDAPAGTRFVGVLTEAIAACGVSAPRDRDFFSYSADPALASLLSAQGLEDVTVGTVAFQHFVATTDDLWSGLFAGTDRSSATLVSRQPKDVQRRIQAVFERRAGRYRVGDRLELPTAAKVASGRRPVA
jgi:SAM-dependent methyltransferase